MSQHDEDAMADLTDEERAALLTEDPSEKELFDPDAEPAPVEPEPEAQPEAAPAPEAAPTAEPEPAAPAVEPAPEAEAQPAPAPAAEKPAAALAPAPVLIANVPEDAKSQMEDIKAQRDAAWAKWQDGEITSEDYRAQEKALEEKHFDLKLALHSADMAARMQQQQIENQWTNDCNKFLADNPEYADKERLAMLDASVRALALIPANQGLANHLALEKAHKMVKGAYGEAVSTTAPAAKPTVKQPVVPKPEIPPNIGNAPAASMNDTNGGEFAALARLQQSGDVLAFEAAFDKLSEAQQAKFLRS